MADKIIVGDTTKPGLLKVTGPTMVNNKVTLASLDGTGAVLNDTIAFNGATWVPSAAAPSADTASNLGAGANVFKSKVGADFQFRSVIGTGSVTATQNANDVTLNGAVITASNLGAGNGIFSSKIGNDLQFKSLLAGSNITLTPTGTDITIASTGGGGTTLPTGFNSGDQTILFPSSITLAHGLAAVPRLISYSMRCTSADQGYSVGDLVDVQSGLENGSGQGLMTYKDATNITILMNNSIWIRQKANPFTIQGAAAAKWVLIIDAWK